uniref:THUMP domain-containing protein n=1 Tax=Ciona savignyi TaxID=51511 RepID=H2ZB54_CIOSA
KVTFGATVPTGFEFTAVQEIREKINAYDCETAQGKVFFTSNFEALPKIHQLRSVDKLFLVIKRLENYVYDETKEVELAKYPELAKSLPWQQVEEFWKLNRPHCKKLNRFQKEKLKERMRIRKTKLSESGKPENAEDQMNFKNRIESLEQSSEIRFRVTGNRVGKKQSVTSQEADYCFGGHVQDATGWKVDLSFYNVEVLLDLGVDSLMVALSLTLFSLHHRNISHFGRTTLRSTIAYNMLRLCAPQPGDIVVDPMCGSGSIPLEGAMQWKDCFHVAGDNCKPAVSRTTGNVLSNDNCPVEVIRWDATRLPWKSGSIDVCVTDLPFGRRMGSQTDNRILYPRFLFEVARVAKLGVTRTCILTYDRRSALKAISQLSKFWSLKRTVCVNIGGLRAAVYLLNRTNHVYDQDFIFEEKRNKYV